MTARLLVVDDDRLFSSALEDFFSAEGLEVGVAYDCACAERLLRERRWDVLLLDIHLPDGSGLELIQRLGSTQHLPIVVVTADANICDALHALRTGVYDYLIKPVGLQQLLFAVLRSLEASRTGRVASLEERRRERESWSPASATHSKRYGETLDLAQRAARSAAPVLLTGETGTGKTVLARKIHRDSAVADGPFVAINCGAIPPTLVEAELFGTELGAYTGARARSGLFELASGGTLFLDEVAELPLAAQATLLGAIEDGRIRRVGAQKETPVDVRLVAATNVVLSERVEAGGFRADLRYRLDVLAIELPPLRERLDDIGQLINDLLGDLAGSRRGLQLGPGELEALRQYGWPGNIRELRNVLERAVLFVEGNLLRPSVFLPIARPSLPVTDEEVPLVSLAEVERAHILGVLAQLDGRRERAATVLGVSPATLRRRLAGYRAERSI